MKLLEKPPKKIALNITPLIDVLFILIIFFTVSSTFLEQPGIELKLPDAESSQTHTAQKVIIYVDKDETVFLNDEQVNLEILVGYVQAKLAEQKDNQDLRYLPFLNRSCTECFDTNLDSFLLEIHKLNE